MFSLDILKSEESNMSAAGCDICQDQYRINAGAELMVTGRPGGAAGRLRGIECVSACFALI